MFPVAEVEPFDPDAGGPGYVWQAVARHLESRIRAGEWGPGDRLPSGQALAAQYDVAPGTMTRAITDLRERGVVVVVDKKGTYVAVTGPGQ